MLSICLQVFFLFFHIQLLIYYYYIGFSAFLLFLLWFVREREAVFGFVLSYYPDEEELDELQAKMEEVLNYIPVKHLTLCLPDADNLLNSSEEDEVKQWKTVELAKDMAARIFFA